MTNLTVADDSSPSIPSITKEQTTGVDWLTITTKDIIKRRGLYNRASLAIQDIRAEGNDVDTWKWQGYSGLATRGMKWGTRADTDIVILSGDVANARWPEMLALAENATRVDLAVTVLLNDALPDFAWDIYRTVATPLNTKVRCKKFSIVKNNDGGETLYVGSRASDQVGRLYDKGRENPKPLNLKKGLLWRYEVEFKGKRAQKIATQLLAQSRVPLKVGNGIAHTVQEWFFCRGIPSLLVVGDGSPLVTSVTAALSDDDVVLRWLSTQVRPSVKRLVDKGKIRMVNEALNFSPLDKDEYS